MNGNQMLWMIRCGFDFLSQPRYLLLNATIKLVGELNGTNELGAPFGTITSVPTMYVFNQQGKAAETFYGAPKDLHERAGRVLDSLLAKKPRTRPNNRSKPP